MKIYTISIPNARIMGIDKSPGYLDITIGSGDKVFAPTWNMVHGIKDHTITEELYTHMYKHMMYESIKLYPNRWVEISNMDVVYLACYCRPGSFCHRYLLASILVENYHAEYLGEYVEKL